MSRGDRRYVPVATNEGPSTYRYGVDVETGIVMFLEDTMPQFDCLTNTNIAGFVLMLGRYEQRYLDLPSATKDAVWAAVDALFDELGTWDPDALRDEGSRWNILLDEHAMDYSD